MVYYDQRIVCYEMESNPIWEGAASDKYHRIGHCSSAGHLLAADWQMYPLRL